MSINTFFDSLIDQRPIYYHFLDGYINPNYGNSIIKSLDFIKSNNYLLPSKDIKFINFNNKNIFINDLKFSYDNLNTDQKNLIVNNLKYSILPIGEDNHITTLLFFIKNNKFNLLYFNSGLGINNHMSKSLTGGGRPEIIYNDKYYLAYHGIELCNTIDNNKIIDLFLSFILLCNLYNLIKYELTPIKIKKYNQGLQIKYNRWTNDSEIIIIDPLLVLIEKINKLNPDLNININFFFEDEIFKKNIYYDNDSIYTFDQELINEDDDVKVIVDCHYIKFRLIIVKEFHDFMYFNINNIRKNDQTKIFDIKKYCGDDLSNFNFKITTTKEINYYVEDKTTLHLINNNLYIKQQESGSCSWFSFYWIFVYYNLRKYKAYNILCNVLKQ
jgi:hypothetical protein